MRFVLHFTLFSDGAKHRSFPVNFPRSYLRAKLIDRLRSCWQMIGTIITRGRNSGLKCLSTGSLPPSLQYRSFLWARNLLSKAPCWNFPKSGGDGASQREREGGGEREEKTPAWKHCENEKHPLIRRTWPLFRKWVADSNKTTKQSLQSKDSHCLKKNKLEFIIVFILTESQCNSPQLMKLQFNLQFILLNSSL